MPTFYRLPDDAPATTEVMGTKRKFWFQRDKSMWLFKATRPGEHWAEVFAAALASQLGLPHASYEFATWKKLTGVVSPSFIPKGFQLVHGNELLAHIDPSYPREGERYVRTREHTIDAVKTALDDEVQFPIGWAPLPGIESAIDVFAGYLLLDAWIGNIDRHHENWGVVFSKDSIHLAPTFDHPASLGAQLKDSERSNRLKSRDPAFQVNAYVQRPRVRSALHLKAEDDHALGLLEAFSVWSQGARNRAVWIERLASIDDATITSLASQVLSGVASEPATAFALEMLKCNKKRIMERR